MMAGQLNAAPTRQRRALDDIYARPILPLHVAIACREILGTAAIQVARDRERLEKHLGHDDRTPQIQHDAAVVQIGQHSRQALEVAVTGFPDRRAVRRWMLMDDYGADRSV